LHEQDAIISIVVLRVNESASHQRHNLSGERVCNFLNREDRVYPWQLLLLRDSVELDFVSDLASESEEKHIRNESAHKNTPFDLKPDHHCAEAFRVGVPLERLWENVNASRDNRDNAGLQDHTNEGRKSLKCINVEHRITRYEINDDQRGVPDR